MVSGVTMKALRSRRRLWRLEAQARRWQTHGHVQGMLVLGKTSERRFGSLQGECNLDTPRTYTRIWEH